LKIDWERDMDGGWTEAATGRAFSVIYPQGTELFSLDLALLTIDLISFPVSLVLTEGCSTL
jgi:hypothetical protein